MCTFLHADTTKILTTVKFTRGYVGSVQMSELHPEKFVESDLI